MNLSLVTAYFIFKVCSLSFSLTLSLGVGPLFIWQEKSGYARIKCIIVSIPFYAPNCIENKHFSVRRYFGWHKALLGQSNLKMNGFTFGFLFKISNFCVDFVNRRDTADGLLAWRRSTIVTYSFIGHFRII